MKNLNTKIDNEIDILIDINKNLEKKENILFENMENIIKLYKQKNNFFLEKNNFFINNINISEELKIFLNITNNNNKYNLFFDFLIDKKILINKNIINYDEKIEKLFNLNKKDILTFNNLNFHLQKHFI